MTPDPLTLDQVVDRLEVEPGFVEDLVRERIVITEDGRFGLQMVERIRVSWNLYELGVNLPGIEVALDLLERLERERQRG